MNVHKAAVEVDDRLRSMGVVNPDARARRIKRHAELVRALDPLFANALEQQAFRVARNQQAVAGVKRIPHPTPTPKEQP